MSKTKHFDADEKKASKDHWPIDGYEELQRCPICEGTQRKKLYDGLVDNTFFCAPGKWSLWSCSSCGAAYLDPRPSLAKIDLAYESYYTHINGNVAQSSIAGLGRLQKLRRVLVNGYTNWRFGTKERYASVLGIFIVLLLPFVRKSIDNRYRNLPKRNAHNARLLDLGCGNGAFLKIAKSCGWDVVGVDPDFKAVKRARDDGFDVYHGGIDIFSGQKDLFDYICMSHVVEHLHDPLKTLAECHRILKPGGTIWIETPNIDSFGREYFGVNWRGLEAPRHLVIHSRKSLVFSLKRTFFNEISWSPDKNVYKGMFRKSYEMGAAANSELALRLPIKVLYQAFKAKLFGLFFVDRREFLIVTARKLKA